MKKKSLYEALMDVIMESTEEEINEVIREAGQDPEDILKRGCEAIQKALLKSKMK